MARPDYYSPENAARFGLRIKRGALAGEEREALRWCGALGHRIVILGPKTHIEASDWDAVSRAWKEDGEAKPYVRTKLGWRQVVVA